MTLKIIGVLGAGQMGSGIAQVMAWPAEVERVFLVDVSPAMLDKATASIAASLQKLVSKQKLSPEQAQQAAARIAPGTDWSVFAQCDVVIEAIAEDEALKCQVFAQLDATAPSHALLASNTSSIAITRLASATQRPEQVMGMHFMNPVPLMPLVELIAGAKTSTETRQQIKTLAQQAGKTTVESQDFPGFISNRLLMPLLNEAIFALHEGVGSAEDIDAVMTLGMNHPMGPLKLADFIGLDTVLAILRVLYDGFKDARFRPCPLLVHYVNAGWLGKKAGRGFYVY